MELEITKGIEKAGGANQDSKKGNRIAFELTMFSERIVREEDKQVIAFIKKEDRWIYHAPNAQEHTVEQLEIIVTKLKELNGVQ